MSIIFELKNMYTIDPNQPGKINLVTSHDRWLAGEATATTPMKWLHSHPPGAGETRKICER